MTKQDLWFLEERAVAFASLVLTKGRDVCVQSHDAPNLGSGLLVEILKDGKSTLRFFGVQLVALMDLPNLHNARERAGLPLPTSPEDATLPFCLFVIGVRKPEGVYRWLIEPAVDDGKVLLSRDTETDWQSLDDAGVTRLISQVNRWYHALNGKPIGKPHVLPSIK